MFKKSWKMRGVSCIFVGTAFFFSAGVAAQSSVKEEVGIDLKGAMSGVSERSKVAMACTRAANAAVFAHEQKMLSHVTNEAAKFKATGSSEDPFFNDWVKVFQLDPTQNFLPSALIFSQLNIMWLEEKGPYRKELEPVYTAYLAATCARAAKYSPAP